MAKAKIKLNEKAVGAIVISVVALIVAAVIIFITVIDKNKLINGNGNLMEGIKAQRITDGKITDDFKKNYANFCLKLLESNADSKDNVAFAPSNVMSATAFLGAASDGNTKAQIEKALGMSAKEAGEGLSTLETTIAYNKDTKAGLKFSNTTWLNATTPFGIKKTFLEENGKYYGLGVIRENFALENIEDVSNEPIFAQTPSTFSSFQFGNSEFMNIISGASFEADWNTKVSSKGMVESLFAGSESEQVCEFFKCVGSKYISGETFSGSVNKLKGGYSFVGLVPKAIDENEMYYYPILEMVWELQANNKLLNLIKDAKSCDVSVLMPNYANSVNCPTTTNMNKALEKMDVTYAFSGGADFTNMAPNSQNLRINNVAAAGDIRFSPTGIVPQGSGGKKFSEKELDKCDYCVRYGRSFLYFIFNDKTGLPVYCGILNKLS